MKFLFQVGLQLELSILDIFYSFVWQNISRVQRVEI